MSGAGGLHLFVLIDALGWRILEGREFLSDLLPFRVPLRTVLGYSSGAIPTILTGRPPARHGHWNLFYYDPDGSPFRWLRRLGFLPAGVLDSRLARKALKEVGRRVLGLGPLFECCVSPRLLPWFNWVEKRSVYEPGGIAGAPSIFDDLAAAGIPARVYSYHRWTDQEILRRAREDLQGGAARFYFLYLSELDGALHAHCGDETAMAAALDRYASGLREVFDCARRLDPESRLTVFSDHGMTPVRQRYDLVGAIDALGFGMPADYLAVYDSTMARFWFFRDEARHRITARLGDLPCGRIVPGAELEELGVLFADRRYGDVVFLLEPGWLVSQSDFNGSRWSPSGMHGYHPEDPDSDGIFLSSGPPSAPVRSIADIHSLMVGAAMAMTDTLALRSENG